MDTQNWNMEPKKKSGNGLVGLIIGIALGVMLLVVGIGIMFLNTEKQSKENEEPVDIYYATGDKQYCSAEIQYLSESFATFNAHDQLNVYLGFDADSNPYVIAIKDKDIGKFEQYIDYLYSEEEVPLPEGMTITGYSELMDSEMRKYVVEYFNEFFGEELMTSADLPEWVGNYFLNYGEKKAEFKDNTPSYILIGIGIFFICIFSYSFSKKRKENQEAEMGMGNTSSSAYQGDDSQQTTFQSTTSAGEIASINYGLGIVGAIIGALIASGLWFFCSMLEIIAGIVAFAAVYIPIALFKKFGGGINKPLMFICAAIGLAMLIPANFLSYGYAYYKELNEVMNVPFTYFEALEGLPSLMKTNDLWMYFWKDLIIGYVLGAACFPWKQKEKGNKNNKSISENANISQEVNTYQTDSTENDLTQQ